MNWGFAFEAAGWMAGLTFVAIWMITAAYPRQTRRPRSDSEQQ